MADVKTGVRLESASEVQGSHVNNGCSRARDNPSVQSCWNKVCSPLCRRNLCVATPGFAVWANLHSMVLFSLSLQKC